jgi:hypothetical protein
MSASPARGVAVLQIASVTVAPAHFLAGWRPDSGSLFLPVFSDAHLGAPVAVRVGLVGHPIRATLFGVVALVRRIGRPSLPPGAEISLDGDSRRTAGLLAAAARGEEVSFRDRPPRFVAARTLLAVRDDVALPATTTNLSSSGCALTWSGTPPRCGEEISLKLGEGLLAATPRAVVAWAAPAGRGGARVGLRMIATGRGQRAWEKLVAELERAGALKV